MEKTFNVIPHTADLQIYVAAQTKQELFSIALMGMFSASLHENGKLWYEVAGEKKLADVQHGVIVCQDLPCARSFSIQSSDLDALLVDFLSEALTLHDIYNELYLQVDFTEFSDTNISGIFHGISIISFDAVELKAVTYNQLHVEQKNGLWQTNIVFDI